MKKMRAGVALSRETRMGARDKSCITGTPPTIMREDGQYSIGIGSKGRRPIRRIGETDLWLEMDMRREYARRAMLRRRVGGG